MTGKQIKNFATYSSTQIGYQWLRNLIKRRLTLPNVVAVVDQTSSFAQKLQFQAVLSFVKLGYNGQIMSLAKGH